MYPTVVTQEGGGEVLVVQDYTFGKYLGFLEVSFDENGKIVMYGGNPILLNASVEKGKGLMSDWTYVHDTERRLVVADENIPW